MGVAEVELGVSQGQGGASYSNESQLADPEETIVATQLDGIVAVEDEGSGSSSSTIGSLKEGGAISTPDEREQKLAVAMRGGIHQSNKPSWSFRGKLSMTKTQRRVRTRMLSARRLGGTTQQWSPGSKASSWRRRC